MKNELFNNPLSVWNLSNIRFSTIGSKNKPLAYLQQIGRCCKYSYQRITKGYCDKDSWNVNYYLEELIPAILKELSDNHHGSPILLDNDIPCDNSGNTPTNLDDVWTGALEKMIFLWNESKDETCTQVNPYNEEYERCREEFNQKYGLYGEKLRTEKEIEEGSCSMHFMDELPEYQSIYNRWSEANFALKHYKESCRNEAIDLLKKYWTCLWD